MIAPGFAIFLVLAGMALMDVSLMALGAVLFVLLVVTVR